MKLNINLNALTAEDNTTGKALKFDGGNIEIEISPDEIATNAGAIVKALPTIKEVINSVMNFQASENDKRNTQELQLEQMHQAADGYKRSLEETNAKLREENRQQREENRKLREELDVRSSGKVPTKRELK